MTELLVRTLDLRADLPAGADDRMVVHVLPDSVSRAPDGDAASFRESMGTGLPVDFVPAGRYLFTQLRGEPEEQTLAEEAFEQQREGLWRGLALGAKLYVRVLSEENGAVRQLIRELRGGAE